MLQDRRNTIRTNKNSNTLRKTQRSCKYLIGDRNIINLLSIIALPIIPPHTIENHFRNLSVLLAAWRVTLRYGCGSLNQSSRYNYENNTAREIRHTISLLIIWQYGKRRN